MLVFDQNLKRGQTPPSPKLPSPTKSGLDAFDDFAHGHFRLGNTFEDDLHKVVVEQLNVLFGEACGLVSEIEIQTKIVGAVHDGEVNLLL